MRASRTYGSVRGARHETRVPTATEKARLHYPARRCGSSVADCGTGTAAGIAADWISPHPVCEQFPEFLDAFRRGLGESGFVEHRNLAIDYRWAKGDYDLLPSLAAELIRRQVAVIATGGGAVSAQAAKAGTSSIPIVFVSGGDPIQLGLVASLNRPGGNVTGVSPFVNVLGAKRLELLQDLVPSAKDFGVVLNPRHPEGQKTADDVLAAARSLGRSVYVVTAASDREIDEAFAELAKRRVGAVLVATDPFFTTKRDQILALTMRYSLPAIYDTREYAVAGGLDELRQ
jgi:putative tryptophan/tyrosine transport system substrate-binding protein